MRTASLGLGLAAGIALTLAGSCAKDQPTGTDSTAPAAVTDLQVVEVTARTARLTWTAPGDDGTTGTAQSYDLRYSLSPITTGTWGGAHQVNGEPTPQPAGAFEAFTVTGLIPLTRYHFALVTRDEAGNLSGLSNLPEATTSRLLRRWDVDAAGGGDFTTIAEAIAATADDDTVFVNPGTYFEPLVVQGKRIVLAGHDADSTIVRYDASLASHPVLSIAGGANLEVRNLRFVQDFIPCDAGVQVIDSRLVMEGCVLFHCGLSSAGGDLTLRQCTLWSVPPMTCDRIVAVIELIPGGTAVIEQCIVAGGGPGISWSGGIQPTFHCNDFYFNTVNYQGSFDPTGTDGNISADPRFFTFIDGNFHLREDSPCLPDATPGCGRMGASD
jgi:hypothetical protein